MKRGRDQIIHRRDSSEKDWFLRRRSLLALGTSGSAALIAGCSANTEPSAPADITTSSNDTGGISNDSTATSANSGTFRLLISDRPVAIDDFDELTVSFERARVFRAGGVDDEQPEPTQSVTSTETEAVTDTAATTESNSTTTTNETATVTEAKAEGNESAGSDNTDQEGFFVLDLGGASADLTQVVGAKAIDIFGEKMTEGRYSKIELYAASVKGIVDGNSVDVKIPSGKLQLTKPFEVVKGETVRFVFDITVVKKGRDGEYNLLPVISESGVAGRDIEVEEVEPGASSSNTTRGSESEGKVSGKGGATPAGTENESNNGERRGPPDEDNGNSQ